MQKILDTVDEFRENDARMRQALLKSEQADVKEEFGDIADVPVAYSLKQV